MAKTTSKRTRDFQGRPLDYRTPSPPPRSAIEDIYPLTPIPGTFDTSFLRTKPNGGLRKGADESIYSDPNYRTPSPPPRWAIEALTPVRATFEDGFPENTPNDALAAELSNNPLISNSEGKGNATRVDNHPQWNNIKHDDDETEGEDDAGIVGMKNGFPSVHSHNSHFNRNGVLSLQNGQATHQFTSAMDAFATIAMATSPTFAQQSHQLPSAYIQSQYSPTQPTHHHTSQVLQLSLGLSPPSYSAVDERPPKRARSEIPSEQPSAEGDKRPQTSYNNPTDWAQNNAQQNSWAGTWAGSYGQAMPVFKKPRTDISNSDAELLLNVSRATVFARPAEPKRAPGLVSNGIDHVGKVVAGDTSSSPSRGTEFACSFMNTPKRTGSTTMSDPKSPPPGINGGTLLPALEEGKDARHGTTVNGVLPSRAKSCVGMSRSGEVEVINEQRASVIEPSTAVPGIDDDSQNRKFTSINQHEAPPTPLSTESAIGTIVKESSADLRSCVDFISGVDKRSISELPISGETILHGTETTATHTFPEVDSQEVPVNGDGQQIEATADISAPGPVETKQEAQSNIPELMEVPTETVSQLNAGTEPSEPVASHALSKNDGGVTEPAVREHVTVSTDPAIEVNEESEVEERRDGTIAGDRAQEFIQDLREFVERSTGEKIDPEDNSSATMPVAVTQELQNGLVTPAKTVVETVPSPVQAPVAETSGVPAEITSVAQLSVATVSEDTQILNSSKSPKPLRKGWPKGKPRGPRSSWPGVIKAKESSRSEEKSGPSIRPNRHAARKDTKQDEPSPAQQAPVPKAPRAKSKTKRTVDAAQHDVPGAGSSVQQARRSVAFVIFDKPEGHNLAAHYSRPSNKDVLFPTTESRKRQRSLPPMQQLTRGDFHKFKSTHPHNLVSQRKQAEAVLPVAPMTSLSNSNEMSVMEGPTSGTGAPHTVSQPPLRHRRSAPDITLDTPLMVSSGSREYAVGYGDVLPFTRASSAPPVCGSTVAERDSEEAIPSVEREKLDRDSAQSVCGGCSFLPNTLGIDSYIESVSWIKCDGCKRWFHFACAGFTEKEVRSVDKFNCAACWEKCGPTTYVRKSSRAHTSIDYAGLHEGVVKTSEDNPDHPYIKPLKDGTYKFLPDNFVRLPPELATREHFERNGWIDPILIPASMNPRPVDAPDVGKLCGDYAYNSESSPVFIKQAIDYWLAGDFDKVHGPNRGEDALGQVMPQNLTVRKVSHLCGPEGKVEVIDVKSQGEDGPWNMQRWADYYESNPKQSIKNVISLEISRTELGRLIKRPQVVRHLDLTDDVWPPEQRDKAPRVQFYCLMSVKNSFTDFHVDFGGSSVFYHILKGSKTFLFIPPKLKHLKKYEKWCVSPAQNWTFLPDQTKECIRVDLVAGDTMLIPSGWIHAVWTPEDSLVIGGNFLTRLHYETQIQVAEIEKNTKVGLKFRYPTFQKVQWYAAIKYLKDDPLPPSLIDLFNDGEVFERDVPLSQEYDSRGKNSRPGGVHYNARYYSQAELDGLEHLERYLLRVALISSGVITEGITNDTRNRVTRSIPKGYGEPLEIVKHFALWSRWKRGNEAIPHWAYRDAKPGEGIPGTGEKKLSAAALKRQEREIAAREKSVAPERQSLRKRAQIEAAALNAARSTTPDGGPNSAVPKAVRKWIKAQTKPVYAPSAARPRAGSAAVPRVRELDANGSPLRPVKTPKTSVLGPKRVACDECRKRRVRCKHKDELESDDPEVETTTVTADTTPRPEAARDPTPSEQSSLDPAQLSQDFVAEEKQLSQPPIEDTPEPIIPVNTTPGNPTKPTAARASSTASMTPVPSGSGSRGRNKHRACEKCRKNRRRCIHDEKGNVDPLLAQESPLPRPVAASKPSTSKRGQKPLSEIGRLTKKARREIELANGVDSASESQSDVIRLKPFGFPSGDVAQGTANRRASIKGVNEQYPWGSGQQTHSAPMAPMFARQSRQSSFDHLIDPALQNMSVASGTSSGNKFRYSWNPEQQPSHTSTTLFDASERQLLREEADRMDKDVSMGGGPQNGEDSSSDSETEHPDLPFFSTEEGVVAKAALRPQGLVERVATPSSLLAARGLAMTDSVIDNAENPRSSADPIARFHVVGQDTPENEEALGTNPSTLTPNKTPEEPERLPEQIVTDSLEAEPVESSDERLDALALQSYATLTLEAEQVNQQLAQPALIHVEPRQADHIEAPLTVQDETVVGKLDDTQAVSQQIHSFPKTPESISMEPEQTKKQLEELDNINQDHDIQPIDSDSARTCRIPDVPHPSLQVTYTREEFPEVTDPGPAEPDRSDERVQTESTTILKIKEEISESNNIGRRSSKDNHEFAPVQTQQISGQVHADDSTYDLMDLDDSDDLSSPPLSPPPPSSPPLSSPPDTDVEMSEPDSEPKKEPEPKRKRGRPRKDAQVVPKKLAVRRSRRESIQTDPRRSAREPKKVDRLTVGSANQLNGKNRVTKTERSSTPTPRTMAEKLKSISPGFDFPSPAKTYGRRGSKPGVASSKNGSLNRPGPSFAAEDDPFFAGDVTEKEKSPRPEGGSVFGDDDDPVNQAEEKSWRLATQMEFGLRQRSVK